MIRQPRRLTFPSWTPDLLVATWFVLVNVERLTAVASSGPPGFDGRLYREAARTWIAGGDPWTVSVSGIGFAAPPPSLVPMAPFTLLPEPVAVVVLMVLGVAGMLFVVRRLGLPPWFMLFPPFVDGLWNANPDILVLPLLVAGTLPTVVAAFVKIYALVPPLVLGRWRSVALAAAALLVTLPLLPWSLYVAKLPQVQALLAAQSVGGLSATAMPILLPVAVVALIAAGRDRGAWLAVPAAWPATQFYYSTMALPAFVDRTKVSYLAAAILAVPAPGAAVLAVVVIGAVRVWARRRRTDGTAPAAR
jgi:hypothetical protein